MSDLRLDSPGAAVVSRALEGYEGAWLVGGAVRDAIASRPVVDLDLAVGDDPGEVASRIAAEAGGPRFELSSEFRTWRVLAADDSWHVDITALRGGSIEADLSQRDFTINAIAISTAEPQLTIDPFDGRGDLERGVLRAVSPHSFTADPLRVLRAARLGSQLGLAIDEETLELGRATADRAGEPAGERQLAELRLLVGGPDPVRGLDLLDALGATRAVLPELEGLRGVSQNPNHHLDVHGHTVEVLEHLLEVEGDLDRYAGEAADGVRQLLAEPLADDLTRGDALRFGAILHDAGKPKTRQEHEGGFVSFVGHDREGAAIVRAACARLKASRVLSRHLEALTLHHLHLGFMTRERPLSRRRLYEYLKLTAPVAADVTLLTVADRLAARGGGPTATPEMIQAHLDLARDVLPPALEWHRDGPPRVPIGGDELAAAVGIAPGPELGRILDELEAAVYAGEVETAGEAIAYARRSR